jgi:hypothetical protein
VQDDCEAGDVQAAEVELDRIPTKLSPGRDDYNSLVAEAETGTDEAKTFPRFALLSWYDS